MAGRHVQDDAFTVLMASGFIAIPGMLIKKYKRMGLSDEEMMLLLHLIQFRQEGNEMPTSREISERMSFHEDFVDDMVMRLMRMGFLSVEVHGIDREWYDLRPLYRKLNELLEPKPAPVAPVSSFDLLEKQDQGIFKLFEQEFGRPLSPLEYEKIVRWIDEDQYKEEIIREALREAVLSAKFNFKYIDRILFEWQKNNIRTLQELNVYREQFRNRMPGARNNTGGGGKGKAKASEPNEPSNENKYDAFYKMYGRAKD